MDNIIITVLIPNYNNSKYINQTLSSIFDQEYCMSLYKVIICDDKSTDNSVEIINEWVLRYPNNIKLMENVKNCGTLETSIKLYEQVNTKYYTVLDGDDYWINKKFLSDGVQYLENNLDYTIYGTNTLLYDQKEEKIKERLYYSTVTDSYDISVNGEICFTHTSSTIFRNNNIYDSNLLNFLKKKIGSETEQTWEGDSFRNFLHASKGKSYTDLSINSGVYRINLSTSRWTSMSQTHQDILNSIFFIEMHIFSSYKYTDFFKKNSQLYIDKCIKYYKNTKIQDVNVDMNSLFIKYNTLYNSLFFDKVESFVLFLPSRFVGGAEYLFINIALELLKLNYKVYYIDYTDGFARKQLSSNPNINFIEYNNSSDFSVTFNEPINYLTPFTILSETGKIIITNKKINKMKVLHYVIHPKNFEWLMYRANFTFEQANNVVSSIKNEMVFMDRCCSTKFPNLYDNDDKYKYVPIFTPSKEITNYNYNKLINSDEINIGWLGRLDSDKIFSVINTLDNLYSYKTTKKKNFYIVGNGDSINYINLDHYVGNVNVIFLGTLINEEKYNFLINHLDISFSMGTSAIECASLKIPTVVPIVLDGHLYVTNGFTNFFELTDYNMGCYYSDKSLVKLSEFEDIMNDIYINNQKEMYGNLSFSYYNNNHTSKISINSLLNYFL
jgi:glycosyltransferase involved in cell wall biosynthesis